MEQNGTDMIDVFVYTHDNTSGINAWIHFDPDAINITDVNYTRSPWQPMEKPGWSHQGDHVILVSVNFSGVDQGKHKVASMEVDCVCDNCKTNLTIDHAEPDGIIVQNMTFECATISPIETRIKIGSGTGKVALPITVLNAENVGACDITMTYDPDVVKVVNVTDGAMDCTFVNDVNSGELRIGAIQGDSPGITGNYPLATIELGPVGTNSQCDLELTVTTFKDATPDCKPMSYKIQNGTYVSSKNGDVNGDGEVDLADASYIAKNVIGIEGYENIDESVADVTGDGIIDMADSMYLTKHVLGIAGFEKLR